MRERPSERGVEEVEDDWFVKHVWVVRMNWIKLAFVNNEHMNVVSCGIQNRQRSN